MENAVLTPMLAAILTGGGQDGEQQSSGSNGHGGHRGLLLLCAKGRARYRERGSGD